MSKPYIIIQCSNYFEYINLKSYLKSYLKAHTYKPQYFDSTYTIKVHNSFEHFNRIPKYVKSNAPTANVTQVSFRNGRAIYTKLKD